MTNDIVRVVVLAIALAILSAGGIAPEGDPFASTSVQGILVKYWLITVALLCITVILGTLAWRAANHREHWVTKTVSGSEALEFAERAKRDKWLELVEFGPGGELIPVPNDRIDDHLRTHKHVVVRRYLSASKTAEMSTTLDALAAYGGGPAAAELAEDMRSDAASVSYQTWGWTIGTVVLAIATLISAAIAITRYSPLLNHRE